MPLKNNLVTLTSRAHLSAYRLRPLVYTPLVRDSFKSHPKFRVIKPSPHRDLHHRQHRLLTSSSIAVDNRCPTCLCVSKPSFLRDQSPTASAICHNCASFLPFTAAGSHFSLFGLPKAYRLDRATLRKQYHRWQQVVHPDLALGRQNQTDRQKSGLPKQNQDLQASLGAQWSIAVNRARTTLESDVKRAAYMLDLDGRLTMPDEGGDGSFDPEFLMTLMETHEQLEDAKSEREVEEIRVINSGM
ncbi:hypothetical protein CROQUDRAFT_651577 [Cronartium quercuum f. sp. fusiforme G11]|uniref:Co-chaperone HscB C-terminal oligomerisation domain-containing protein n=1 Tax=Cronartium quercuum f. sp. fusiforme G11 TaxID=708437 RepID=A0A9P6TGT0_9BASI|nr:hypothetical protein CROQUDRAFT_651577 [Cronartium quercuum f. sp. fusiforme G11]